MKVKMLVVDLDILPKRGEGTPVTDPETIAALDAMTEGRYSIPGLCAFCAKDVDADAEFKDDEVGKQEWSLSSLCLNCQKQIYDFE